MNFDNNYRARNGQNNNKNRNRNRNRRPNTGNGGNTGGTGNAPNRVYESNGPDVKVRGTAQTVAEKYDQLGRDAQSAGDNVMAESYYQHAEHYYRIWASNQPAGHTLQAFRKPGDEGFEEEVEDNGEGDADGQHSDGEGEPQAEGQESTPEQPNEAGEQGQPRSFRQRDNNRDNRDNRDNRERYKPRWQNRRDSNPEDRTDEPTTTGETPITASAEVERIAPQVSHSHDVAEENDRWEAPSFLTRPVIVAEAIASDEPDTPAPERKPRARRAKAVVDVMPEKIPDGEDPSSE